MMWRASLKADRKRFLVAIAITWATGCGGDDQPAGTDARPADAFEAPDAASAPDAAIVGTGESTTVSVGSAGGTVELEGARLDVPAGALDEAVSITITSTTDAAPTGHANYSPIYRFEPAGLSFELPVTVTVAFVGSPSSPALFWSRPGSAEFDIVGDTVAESAITAEVTHFSSGYVGEGTQCTPRTCAAEGWDCGTPPDGCGGTLTCGNCTPPDECGGGGAANVCGQGVCVPTTCAAEGKNCGTILDGCGETLNCGACTPPEDCGGGGTANVCGEGTCTPTTCMAEGKNCGSISDGCGNILDCGTCTPPETCEGGGVANVCGCTPTTCIAEGWDCGAPPDGCGGTLTCGTCTSPESCEGSGTPYVCGCTPTTCVAEGWDCGTPPDGCGGTLTCGSCTPPESCEGGGASYVCGCTPTTCIAEGWDCGTPPDGCGGTLTCGSCTGPDTCEGGGHAFQCGHGFCSGDYTIASLADVAAVQDCAVIGGNLYITAGGFTFDLPLLEEVQGKLSVQGASEGFANIDFLSNLSAVGGDLILNSVWLLQNVGGLSNLVTIGGSIDVVSDNQLTDLSGLNGVTSVGGNVRFQNNFGLVDLNGLNGLSSIGGDLQINYNDALTSISGFSSLVQVEGDVLVYWDNLLPNLNGLGGLQTIGGQLEVSGNSSLTSLGLSSLSSVGTDIYLESNESLTDISSLTNLTEVVGYFSIAYNDNLATLDGLDNLTSVGKIQLWELPSLGDISSLGAFTTVDQEIYVDGTGLTSLAGLSHLVSVGETLDVAGNDAMTSLGLDALTYVGVSAEVSNNHNLPTCIALELQDQLVAAGSPNDFACVLNKLDTCGGGWCGDTICGDDEVCEDPPLPDIFICPEDCCLPVCPTNMVALSTFTCIDAYEASRPDATDVSFGTDESYAVSQPGVLPWIGATFWEADSACVAADKYLCSAEGWWDACNGSATGYPYGDTYVSDACNGADFSASAILPTGSLGTCEGGLPGMFDMSGNVEEWTSDCHDDGFGNCLFVVKGGSFADGQSSLSCEASHEYYEDAPGPNTGFRCCKDNIPPL